VQDCHRSGRRRSWTPPRPEYGRTASATHRRCRVSGSGLRSGSLVVDQVSGVMKKISGDGTDRCQWLPQYHDRDSKHKSFHQ